MRRIGRVPMSGDQIHQFAQTLVTLGRKRGGASLMPYYALNGGDRIFVEPQSGYVVGRNSWYRNRPEQKELYTDDILEFIGCHASDHPIPYDGLGVWWDALNEKWWIDTIVCVPTRSEAMHLCREFGQAAYYDVVNGVCRNKEDDDAE